MLVLTLAALLIWMLAMSMTLYGTRLASIRFRSSPPHLDAPFRLYPVSILKPMKGADAGLPENLSSFFELDYPEYEVIFSVARADDPAVAIVERMICNHPAVSAKLVIGNVQAGPNPKVNNLIRGYDQALHDWILISDSNVRVPSDYLKRMMGHVENGVGLVTSVVSGNGAAGTGGMLESVYLNTFYARGMLLAESVGQACVVGKSMLFRRSVASRFGGIRILGQYLAEDYMAGKAIEAIGLKVVVASDPVPQFIGRIPFSSFWARHIRWGRIRKAQAPLAFLVEPLFGSVVSGVLGAMAGGSLFDVPVPLLFVLHWGIWLSCDFGVARLVQRNAPGASFVVSSMFWMIRELLAFPLWLHIFSGNTVEWRGRTLRLLPGGLLEPT